MALTKLFILDLKILTNKVKRNSVLSVLLNIIQSMCYQSIRLEEEVIDKSTSIIPFI